MIKKKFHIKRLIHDCWKTWLIVGLMTLVNSLLLKAMTIPANFNVVTTCCLSVVFLVLLFCIESIMLLGLEFLFERLKDWLRIYYF